MAETISLDVHGKVPKNLLERLYQEITPEYITELLKNNVLYSDTETIDNVVSSYAEGFPTKDLALKAVPYKGGMKFWGIASGYASRLEKVAVKYFILDHIQKELAKAGIKSELNIAGLNRETIEHMEAFEMFKGRLPELKRIAKQKGNLGDTLIGVYATMNTPV